MDKHGFYLTDNINAVFLLLTSVLKNLKNILQAIPQLLQQFFGFA